MKSIVLTLATLALVAPAIAAETSRATKQQAVTPAPVQLEKAPAEPAQLEKKPARSKRGEPFTVRINTTPDINQNMSIGEFLQQIPKGRIPEFTPPPEIGQDAPMFYNNMCAPTAVANHLVWLDTHFFHQISEEQHPVIAGVELARILGGTNYMKTADTKTYDGITGTGTKIYNLVGGTYRLLQERGVTVKKVKVISVTAHPDIAELFGVPNKRLTIEHRVPKVSEIKEALRRRAIVINLIGKYEIVPGRAEKNGKTTSGYLERTGGHYFSPVGYGEDSKGDYDGRIIIYHDPADGGQTMKTQHHVEWLKEAQRNRTLRMIKKDEPDHSFRACKDNKNWTCYGELGDTYVRDKLLKDHGEGKRAHVLEGLIVIEV